MDLTIASGSRGTWRVLSVDGDLDLASSPTLVDEVRRAGGGPHALDLTSVTFIDSSGVSALVSTVRHAEERGVRSALVVPTGSPVERLLVLTGLDDVVTIVASLEDLDGT